MPAINLCWSSIGQLRSFGTTRPTAPLCPARSPTLPLVCDNTVAMKRRLFRLRHSSVTADALLQLQVPPPNQHTRDSEWKRVSLVGDREKEGDRDIYRCNNHIVMSRGDQLTHCNSIIAYFYMIWCRGRTNSSPRQTISSSTQQSERGGDIQQSKAQVESSDGLDNISTIQQSLSVG